MKRVHLGVAVAGTLTAGLVLAGCTSSHPSSGSTPSGTDAPASSSSQSPSTASTAIAQGVVAVGGKSATYTINSCVRTGSRVQVTGHSERNTLELTVDPQLKQSSLLLVDFAKTGVTTFDAATGHDYTGKAAHAVQVAQKGLTYNGTASFQTHATDAHGKPVATSSKAVSGTFKVTCASFEAPGSVKDHTVVASHPAKSAKAGQPAAGKSGAKKSGSPKGGGSTSTGH